MCQGDEGEMGVAITRHYELLDAAIVLHGGVRPVEQGEGDSVVGAFARPSDAIAAALAAQRAFAEEPWGEGRELRIPIALHTGEAQLRGGEYYVGRTVIRCARLLPALPVYPGPTAAPTPARTSGTYFQTPEELTASPFGGRSPTGGANVPSASAGRGDERHRTGKPQLVDEPRRAGRGVDGYAGTPNVTGWPPRAESVLPVSAGCVVNVPNPRSRTRIRPSS